MRKRIIDVIVAVLLVSLLTLIGIVVFLLIEMASLGREQEHQFAAFSREQEQQLDSFRQELENQWVSHNREQASQLAELDAEQKVLSAKIVEQENKLKIYEENYLMLYQEFIAAQNSWFELYQETDRLNDFIFENYKDNKNWDFNNDERASTLFIPKQAIALLDKMVAAISAGDEDLYLSVLSVSKEEAYENRPYLLFPFENNKNKSIRISKIETYVQEVSRLQAGGFFVRVLTVDDKGKEEVLHSAIGMNRPEGTYWRIYDFD